jgi:hypothetical protein
MRELWPLITAANTDVGNRQGQRDARNACVAPPLSQLRIRFLGEIRGTRILERAIQRVTERTANANAIVDEAIAAGLDGSDRIVVGLKMLRAELLSVKADLERELERIVLDCTVCGRTVHFIGGLGVRAGHWGHAEPAPHGEPAL